MYWFTGLLGVLMVIAPWMLRFSDNTMALWTSIVLESVLLVNGCPEKDREG